jgi:molybdate transport system regulatory protein
MKTSIRNQLKGKVSAVRLGSVNAEVVVTLDSGTAIVASITNESVANLGLNSGKDVLALIKAPHVSIMVDTEGYRLSTRNQLAGKVIAITEGPVTSEIDVVLEQGEVVVSTITTASVRNLELSPGKPVFLAIKASAVVLAAKLA